MAGNGFLEGFYDHGTILFWDYKPTRERFNKRQPIQVFACWNGVIAVTAKPFMDGTIRFRGIDSYEDKECFQGEPNLLAKDL